ncbi:MAG: HEAT repeat domain-containing protein [Cyanobacteriota bacterium]|nr:HEAT repeat domain-containing protein [Cyanobacteriota bacterium]
MLKLLQRAATAGENGQQSEIIHCLHQLPSQKCGAREIFLLSSDEAQQVVQLATRVLEAGDFQERWEIARLWSKLGTIAIAPVISLLQDEEAEWEVRWFAARILGEFEQPEAIAALVETLQTSEDEELAAMAASVLASFGPRAVEGLAPLLQQPETKELAARSLSQIRCTETIDPLLALVEDTDSRLRALALEALSSFRDSRIPPVLIEALSDPAPAARKEAAIGLGLRPELATTLNLVSRLKPLLYDRDGVVRTAAAIALGRIGTPDASALLFETLIDETNPFPLQKTLIHALIWVETSETLDYLCRALPFVSPLCIEEIIKALGRIKSPNLQPQAVQILLSIERERGERAIAIKQALARAWGQLRHESAISALQQLRHDANERVRLHALAALEQFQDALVSVELKQG